MKKKCKELKAQVVLPYSILNSNIQVAGFLKTQHLWHFLH